MILPIRTRAVERRIAELTAIALEGERTADDVLAADLLGETYITAPGLVEMVKKNMVVEKAGDNMHARLNYVFISADELDKIIEDEKELAIERYRAFRAACDHRKALKKKATTPDKQLTLEL